MTQSHEQLVWESRGTARFMVPTDPQGTSERFQERHRYSPVDVQLNGGPRMDVTTPSACSLAFHLQNSGLSWGLGWNRWNLLPTSLGRTEHGTPTHPPSGRRRQPGPPQRLGSHRLEARGSPSHSQEHLSLKDVIVTNHKDLDSKSCYPFSHGGPSFAHQTPLPRQPKPRQQTGPPKVLVSEPTAPRSTK
ncbi:hypothetical protein PAL_GLEAN10003041 [Pteropus alecto]|uniref:Uncharacterized protein n=1 Tax=Pteropus alecto TaxID=9402 RepID=L5KCT4_PTEAL|nr:hypothetical protein PAL_GLEAN10003041 [Pteropus alecto]